MSDDLPPITDEIPDTERGDVGPGHTVLVAQDGTVDDQGDADGDA